MGRSPTCCFDNHLKKGPWTPEEDQLLMDYIEKNGHGSWRTLANNSGLNRCGKSCRLRWINYLNPEIKRGKFSLEEERIITNLHSTLGNKWSKIAAHLPGRTDNEIKNFWNTHMKKKLLNVGKIDPSTQQISDLHNLLNLSHVLSSSSLNNIPITPWNNNIALSRPLINPITHFATTQLLANILQTMHRIQLPSIEEIHKLQNHYLAQANGSGFSETMKPSQVDAMKYLNPNIFPKQMPSDHHNIVYDDIANLMASSSDHNVTQSCGNSWLSTPESSLNINSDQLMNARQFDNNMQQLPTDQSVTAPCSSPDSDEDIFEEWEKLVDDETNSSFWRDIIIEQNQETKYNLCAF